MERRKNLPVLPSNAPALSPRNSILSSHSEDLLSPPPSQICQKYNRGLECRVCNLHHICSTCQQPGHGAHLCQSGILRTTSGNANLTPLEPSIFENKGRSESRYETKTASTYVNPPYHTAQAAIRLAQKKERRNIWQRWELASPRYLAYRRKARSKKPGSKEDVWPDDVEEAFQIAIRLYAKRGRTKDELNGRQAGGNEFISDWIEKQTGHRRCRKQISSHIQTLKGFLGDVPSWMDLVTAWPPGKHEKAKVIRQGNTDYEDPDFISPTSIDSVRPIQRHGNNPNARPPPSAILGSNTSQGPNIRGVQFDMHLSNEATATKTHIYTSIQSEIGSSPRTLEQVPHWQSLFPHLATRYNEGRIDCPLVLFESRLRLIDDIHLGLSLGIEFAIEFSEGAYFQDWRSLTRVHKQEITPQYFNDAEFESTWDRLECLESSGGQSDIQLTVPFKSKWWVKLFSSIISKRDGARNAKDREAIKWADEYPTAYLRELSIMQELWATPRGGSSQRPQRMAILLWTFSQTRNGDAATTTWRPLTLSTSNSPYQVQEPMLRGMQPSMNLDSALSDSMGPAHAPPSHQQTSDFYASHGHQPPSVGGLFFETSEALLQTSQISECNTSATTPILDYNSSTAFPSSTSSSFPSSISTGSGYPAHHGSSFDSQDGRSTYTHSLESSFHSQHSHQDLAIVCGMSHSTADSASAKFGEPVSAKSFDSQADLLYSSQPGSVYGGMNDSYGFDNGHSSQVDQGDDTIIVTGGTTGEQDFTGGAIHLGYAGANELSPGGEDTYRAPLVAPRANMLPQQQVEQSLQSFESWVPPPPTPVGLRQQQQRQQQQQQQNQQQNPPQDIEDDDTASEAICGNGQRQSISHDPNYLAAGQQHESPTQIAQAEGAGEDDDDEAQRQQQLQYLHDAQDHWQQSFHPSLWPGGLQLPGEGIMEVQDGGTSEVRGQGQAVGEMRERVPGLGEAQDIRGWERSSL